MVFSFCPFSFHSVSFLFKVETKPREKQSQELNLFSLECDQFNQFGNYSCYRTLNISNKINNLAQKLPRAGEVERQKVETGKSHSQINK